MEGPKPEEQTEQPETEAQPSPVGQAPYSDGLESGGIPGWVQKWGPLIMLLVAVLSVTPIAFAVVKSFTHKSGETSPLVRERLLSFVPQVKRKGVRPWGEAVEMPEEGGRILLGLRAQATSFETISGLTVHLALPDQATLVSGRCRYGVNSPGTASLPDSIIDDGVELPDLRPGDWVHVVCPADVSGEAHGGSYKAEFSVISNQTHGADGAVTIKVPATSAEEAVRGLYSTTEEESKLWGGEPEMGKRSKRLLISQWRAYTLEHGHPFAAVPAERTVRLTDLSYEHTLDGRVAELRAKVMTRPGEYPAGPGMVKQSLELGAPDTAARLICYVPRPASHLIAKGDVLDVKVVLIAWPRASTGSGPLTLGICPAARVDRGNRQPLSRRTR